MKERLTETREIRASFNERHIVVYQAYNGAIARNAVKAQTFVSPFKKERMTWIKPSFLWTMYRSGWATKPDQERILRIEITREGFEWALQHACLASYSRAVFDSRDEWQQNMAASPVRIQWDPERDIHLNALPYRAIQIGIAGNAVEHFITDWIVKIDDITPLCTAIKSMVTQNKIAEAEALLPRETAYPVPDILKNNIGMVADVVE